MTGTFEGVGSLQFTPDNKYCWAYSGDIAVTNLETTALNFGTNSEYIRARFQLSSDSGSSDNIRSIIYFNDIQVYSAKYQEDNLKPWSDTLDLHLIIPPFTNVKFTLANASSVTAREHFVQMVGKVHGAIEQQNLESITDDNKWASK